jgi:ABC-2 type transport system ATP-binding protein
MSSRPRPLAIEVSDLVKTYPGDVHALAGVTFGVGEGEILALLGPNGAGKTTTIKILTTLSKPTSGTAHVAGIDVVGAPGRVRGVIGVVGQRSGVDPTATGRENLILQGRFYGLGGRTLDVRVAALLEMVGLTDAAGRPAGTYSGGMVRRLDIALGLVHRPRVLFLDEPTTGLDPEVRAAMWDEIRRLAADEGLTILLTTHYLEEADRLAGRVAILDRGRVVTEGTPDALKADLRGDAIALELRNGSSEAALRGALAVVGGLDELRFDDRIVHLRVAEGATALPGVLAALDSAGIPVAAATVARPSLDDVYLRHTGRSFAAAERTLQETAR